MKRMLVAVKPYKLRGKGRPSLTLSIPRLALEHTQLREDGPVWLYAWRGMLLLSAEGPEQEMEAKRDPGATNS
jgi:hypothetical protein